MTEEQIRQIIREELASLILSDRYTFQKHIQIFDGRHIQLGRSNGTMIGTAADQKIGLYGATPVVQAAHIANPSDLPTALNDIQSILTALENVGILAKS